MKIVIINPLLMYARGGAEINDINLGNALGRMGHEVIHIALEYGKKKHEIETANKIYCIKMPYYYDIATRLVEPLGKLLRTIFFYHFVHCLVREKNDINTADLVLLTGKPMLSKLRDNISVPTIFSVRGIVNKIYYRYLDKVDGLIFWGGCEKDYNHSTINRWTHLNLNAAIQNDFFFPGQVDPKLRREIERGNEKSIIITYTGRLDPIQQLDQVIYSVAELNAMGYPANLVLVGDGYVRDELEILAAKKGIGDKVIFTGLCTPKKVGDYLRASDIFIMNPKFTSYSLSLKEALACGVYAIAPRTGTVAKSLKSDDFAKVFEPNNPEAMFSTLHRVVRKGHYLKRREIQSDNNGVHSWETVAESIVNWSKNLDQVKKY